MEGSIKNFTKILHHKRLYLSLPRISVIGAFDEAWSMLKALPEQQGFTMKPLRTYEYASMSPPKIYDEEEDLYGRQQRRGTIHPAILGMMERRQAPNDEKFVPSYLPIREMPFPNRRVVGQRQPIHLPSAHYMPSPYGAIMVQGPKQLMTGDTSDDELTDAAQRKRGSVFDSEQSR